MKRYIYPLVISMVLFLTGCHDEDNREEAPSWSENNVVTVDPQWKVDDSSLDITSSMNIIAAVDCMQADDRLAAFCDGVCIGVCQPVETKFGLRFYLCIYQPVEASHPVTFAFYSTSRQTVCYWPDMISFTNDAVIGLAGSPYMLLENESCRTPYQASLTYTLSTSGLSDKDELALFCGDECRQLLPVADGPCSVRVNLQAESENLHVRYYSDIKGRIFTSDTFTMQADQSRTSNFKF